MSTFHSPCRPFSWKVEFVNICYLSLRIEHQSDSVFPEHLLFGTDFSFLPHTKKKRMANEKLKPKRTIKVDPYQLTIEQKRTICEWKQDSPAKSTRTLADEATVKFGRSVSHTAVSKLLQKKMKS